MKTSVFNSASASASPWRRQVEQMYDEDRARSALKADLRTALDDHQFELQYQLQNDIKTHAPVGF